MIKTKSLVLLAAGLYTFFLIWQFPANLAWNFLTEKSAFTTGKIAMTGGEGSWTKGRFRTAMINGIEIGSVDFCFHPWALLAGRLQFALTVRQSDTSHGSLNLGVGYRKVIVRNLQGSWAVADIGKAVGYNDLSGSLEVENLDLTARNGQLSAGSGKVSLRGAAIRLSEEIPLGGIRIDLTSGEDGVVATLSDDGGNLQAEGVGVLSPDGSYTFDGTVSARPDSPPDLATLLQVLGRPTADGRIQLTASGQLVSVF